MAAPGTEALTPLQARRLDRERRRRHARRLTSSLVLLAVLFIGHQFLRQQEPGWVQQVVRALLPAAQATPAPSAPATDPAPQPAR